MVKNKKQNFDVSSQGCGKAEGMPHVVLEGVGIGQVHVVAHICRVWRGQVGNGARMLGIDIQRSCLTAKIETLALVRGTPVQHGFLWRCPVCQERSQIHSAPDAGNQEEEYAGKEIRTDSA